MIDPAPTCSFASAELILPVDRDQQADSHCYSTKDVKIIATIFACIFPLIEAMFGGVDSTVIQVERCSY
jgi:hypothetical protein